jgi:hypothetical protein
MVLRFSLAYAAVLYVAGLSHGPDQPPPASPMGSRCNGSQLSFAAVHTSHAARRRSTVVVRYSRLREGRTV